MELSIVFVLPCVKGTKYNLEIDFRGCYRTTTVYNIRITTLYITPGKLISPLLYHYVSHRNNNC